MHKTEEISFCNLGDLLVSFQCKLVISTYLDIKFPKTNEL